MFRLYLVQPLLLFFALVHNWTGDPGIAIVVFSLLIRVPLFPLYYIQHKESDKLRAIQVKMKERTKGIKDMVKQAEIISGIYEEEKFNPFRNFIIQMIPLPIIFAMFAVLGDIVKSSLPLIAFGFIDVKTPNLLLGALTIALQLLFIMTEPKETRKAGFIIVGVVGLLILTFPAAYTLYWATIMLWTIIERKLFHWYEIRLGINPVPKNNS